MTLLAQAAQTAAGGSTAEIVLFWVFAVLALGSALAVISLRNIVHGALMLVLNLLAVAGLYLNLQSSFLAVVQVLVYAGAIMVLFLFVIMLLGTDRDDLLIATDVRTRVLAAAGGALLAGSLLFAFIGPYTGPASVCGQGAGATTASSSSVPCVGLDGAYAPDDGSGAAFLGARLFTRYTYPFELSALLLTVATIGAVIMARRRDLVDEDQDAAATGPLPDSPSEPVELGADVAPGDPTAEFSSRIGNPSSLSDEQEG
jgi:NADH-quinone oxidoreductase subunit J